jgi:hypothetical protein
VHKLRPVHFVTLLPPFSLATTYVNMRRKKHWAHLVGHSHSLHFRLFRCAIILKSQNCRKSCWGINPLVTTANHLLYQYLFSNSEPIPHLRTKVKNQNSKSDQTDRLRKTMHFLCLHGVGTNSKASNEPVYCPTTTVEHHCNTEAHTS